MDFKKLLIRSLSGIVYIAIIIGGILLGTDGILVLASLLAVLATIEFGKICHDINSKTVPTLILDIAGCICLCMSYLGFPILLWIALMMARFIEELYIKSDNPLKNLAHSAMAQIYIGVPLGLMCLTAYMVSPHVLFAMFFLIWINDTGAFIVGSAFGRHKLFERLSPKKSWEGFFGGLIFNLGASALFCYYGETFFDLPHNIGLWLGLGLIVTIFATWGDLIESMIKRQLHIKDSGNLIPGHGGILDRIDSLLLVSPAVFLYLAAYYMI